MRKSEHTTLLLVLTSVALLTWSVTLLVPWPLLALLLVPLLGGVLLTLLTLLAWLVLLVLVRWLLLRRATLLWSLAPAPVSARTTSEPTLEPPAP